MSTVVKDLGAATAYGYAVEKGYTGTEEEFAELMASYATVGQTAVNAAQTATTKASEAATSAIIATNKASEATTAAQTASTKASEAVGCVETATQKATEATQSASQALSYKTDAESAKTASQTAQGLAESAKDSAISAKNDAVAAKTAAQTAQTGAETAAASVSASAAQIQTNADDISELKEDFATMESDGVVPSAEQILSDKGVTDCVPYHFRATGGNGADRLYDQIVGGTVRFNQLASFTSSEIPSASNGIDYAYTDGTSVKITGTATTFENRTGWFGLSDAKGLSLSRLGHIVLVDPRIVSGSFDGNINYGIGASALRPIKIPYIGPLTNSKTNQLRFQHQITSGTVCNDLVVSINVFDLTAMFGTEIAEYIYNLEQSTAGAGVAFFKALFPNDYYPYNAGELVSVSGLSEHKMVGFNKFDKSTVLSGYIINDSTGDALPVSAGKVTDYISVIPNQTYCIKSDQASGGWGAWYDADKNYISSITGYIKDGGNANKLYTAPSGARYMRLTCFYNNSGDLNTFCVNISDPARNGEYEPYKAHSYPLDDSLTLRGLFKLDANNKLYADGDTYEYTGKVTRNTILRAYQSGDESLANAITDGTNTVAYSASASVETADPYQHLQQCDPNGTEEYVSTGIVPIGHNSFYPENLRAKVEGLPWNFASLIAPTEATFTATRNYVTGDLFIVSNVLYKATSNIANGGTITPNTNCTATTLAEIISALA